MHSNAWVIHGDYTESGLPLFSNDFHMATVMPSMVQVNELVFDDFSAIGASFPGIPGIVSGRTKNLAFGVTSSLHDGIDFWLEEIDEENAKYKVDG